MAWSSNCGKHLKIIPVHFSFNKILLFKLSNNLLLNIPNLQILNSTRLKHLKINNLHRSLKSLTKLNDSLTNRLPNSHKDSNKFIPMKRRPNRLKTSQQ